MKISELHLVRPGKIGRVIKNTRLEPHEENTIELLTLYGFNIEVVIPANVPKANNPDILIDGTIWEMKAPQTYNKNKLENRMRKASRQADRTIFDLRNIRKNADRLKCEKDIIKLFTGTPRARRMIIIRNSNKVLDFRKD